MTIIMYYLLPSLWLCGVLYYATSTRQRWLSRPLSGRRLLHLFALFLCLLAVWGFVQIGMTIGAALTYTLLLSMFALAAPVFLIHHFNHAVWPSVIVFVLIATALHFVFGDLYVA
ncbi:hypothetical protein L1077_18895 [Pseudoalteromonas luteoviolacea]|uniref:hypothetical protein n=1 Tax=Pseudoalteromonas luteoviolacea TaxID=43657 RepID=UPI001F275DCF|nr:hypothetical protein [Pseudoalteromonas luteoviolacea]MCF6441507.1 hypothetical protein [Pseudoalteromonas luteoviolacea]